MRYLQQWKQNGDWRIRFRRPGFKPVELPTPRGYRGDKATLGNSTEFSDGVFKRDGAAGD